MCAPAALLGLQLAVSAASGVIGFMGQQQAYGEQVTEYNQNAENARTAAINAWEADQTRANQEGAAATQKKFEANVQTAEAAATAETAAGEGGVSGISVGNLLGDFYAKKGRYNDSVDTNLGFTRNYLTAETKSQQAQYQGQINSVPIPTPPSFAASLVNIFGSGLDAFGQYKQRIA
jgi:hypothetical protein